MRRLFTASALWLLALGLSQPQSVVFGQASDAKPKLGMAVWDAGQQPAIYSPAPRARTNGRTASTAGKNVGSLKGHGGLCKGGIVVVVG